MKQNFRFALLGATALAGAMTFSACSSSDEIVDNPDYNPVDNTVKTTITLNIDPNNAASTRQSVETTQAEGDFRGMNNLLLFTAPGAIPGTDFGACLELDAITSGELSTDQSHKVYTNQEVAVGTTNFLFYGKAYSTNTANSSADDKLVNGYTETTLAKTNKRVNDITFSAASIVPKTDGSFSSGWREAVVDLTDYLNGIATSALATQAWSVSSNPQLRSLYLNFTKESAYRAGSAKAVLKTVQELYDAVYPISVGDGVDATSRSIATAIIANIEDGDYVDVTGDGASLILSWASEQIDNDFPTNLGLPEGAAQYYYSLDGGGFAYLEKPVLNHSEGTPLENYVYPNELYYLTNTPLKATSSSVAVWPETVGDWRDESWTGWSSSVDASTKNIALENNIQYGSALLATQVRCETKPVSSDADATQVLYDNAVGNGADENTPIPYKATAFPLTGVIVGGQPSEVGWNFLPTDGATFNKDVYDGNVISGIYAENTSYSKANYTLVYDNLKPGGDDVTQDNVNICLEFTNNSGVDFYGKDGMILNGQKFYLVATLKLTSGTQETGYSLESQFGEERTFFPSTEKRVFIQDFMTYAKITLSSGSADGTQGEGGGGGALGGATPTIPDLRTSEQSLGLSVDLEWKKGLTFTVNI